MSLKYFKLSKNIIGKDRYWFNQDDGQLSKLPFYSFEQFLIDNNLELVELVKNNRNINISSNTNSATITFNNENEIFDYLIVETNGNRRYYYCDIPTTILNNTGAITLHFILDEWNTFAYDFTKSLYFNHQKVAAIRSQKPRYLKNQNGQRRTIKKNINGKEFYEKINSIAQYQSFSANINYWYKNVTDNTWNARITWNTTQSLNKYNADYNQLELNQKIYYQDTPIGLKIKSGTITFLNESQNIINILYFDRTVDSINNFQINSSNFLYRTPISQTILSNIDTSTTIAIFKDTLQQEFRYNFSLISLAENIFYLEFSNNTFLLKLDPNKIYSTYIKTDIIAPSGGTAQIDLDIEFVFQKDFELYSDIEILGAQNQYYIDENLQLELKNKEINAETYAAENKIYKNDDFFKFIASQLNITLNPTIEYQFSEQPFYENDGSQEDERTYHYLNTFYGGTAYEAATVKSLQLINYDGPDNITTIDVKYVDIFKQDDNNYKYLVVGADGYLTRSDITVNIKEKNQLYFLIPIINEKYFNSVENNTEIANRFLLSPTITTGDVWGINNSWHVLNKATTIYQAENRIGVFTSKISPIIFGYTNRNVIRKICQYSKREPWTTFNNNLNLGITTLLTSNHQDGGNLKTSKLGLIIIDCLPNDIYLTEKPLFIEKVNKLLESINDVEQPPLIIKENEPLLLTSSYSNVKYKADINNETCLSLPFIDTRYMIDDFSINYFIIQAMYLRLSINNWNQHKELSTTADEITIIDNKFVPSQTTAFAEYLNTSATTWDTQRKNATNSFGANTGITAALTLVGIILAVISAGAATPATAAMIGLGATGMTFSGIGNIGKSAVGHSNTLKTINSEIQNKQIETNQTSLPTFAGGLSGSGLWNKNMSGLPLITTLLNPQAEDEIFNKRNIYGVKRFQQQIPFNEMNVRQHFNFIQVDTSYNLGDIIACIKSSNKFNANYNDWIMRYITKYLAGGMLLMNEPIDDLLNDTENYEWEFTKTRKNRIK